MLKKNVKVGGVYLTKINGELRRVRVDQQVTRTSFGGDRVVTLFRVTELRGRKTLRKLRTAGSLREITEPTPQQIHCKWCSQGFPIAGSGTDANLEAAQAWRDRHELSCKDNPVRCDVKVENHGTLSTFTILTADALDWVNENVQSETHNWISHRVLAVEHRYSRLLADGLLEAGFIVR